MLTSFLSEIKSSEMNPTVMNSLVNTLLSLLHHNDRFIRLTAVMWLYEFILLDAEWEPPYARMLRALIPCYADSEPDIRARAEASCKELLASVVLSSISHVAAAQRDARGAAAAGGGGLCGAGEATGGALAAVSAAGGGAAAVARDRGGRQRTAARDAAGDAARGGRRGGRGRAARAGEMR